MSPYSILILLIFSMSLYTRASYSNGSLTVSTCYGVDSLLIDMEFGISSSTCAVILVLFDLILSQILRLCWTAWISEDLILHIMTIYPKC